MEMLVATADLLSAPSATFETKDKPPKVLILTKQLMEVARPNQVNISLQLWLTFQVALTSKKFYLADL